jgi:outer membrane receptor protein involved in Fe transport
LSVPLALAAAADPDAIPRSFSIHSEPYADALVDFALQAGISIGGTTACPGTAPALQGRFTLDEGLRRLLAGASCRFEFADPQTVRLTAAPPPVTPVKSAEAAPPPEEIMVSATKRVAAADRLPASVSVISTAQLDGANDFDTADTVDRVAGMSMTNLGPGRDKIMLRGLSDGTFTGRTQSTVGTYLDALPINYDAPDPDLRLTDVEAVEILRGPQGALYGSGAMSGVYRIVTRKPDLQSYGADVSLGYGLTQDASSSRSADGMVNIPLVAGMAALRVVGYGELEGGYLNNGGLRQSDVDRTIRDGGRAALETRLDDNWTVTAGAALQYLDTADSQYTVGPVSRNRANRVGEANQNDFEQASLTVVEAGDWGRLTSSTGYVHHTTASQYDASAALSLFDDDVASDIGIYDETARIDLLVEDLVATSAEGSPLQWLVGIYGARTLESTTEALRSRGSSHVPMLRYQELRSDHQGDIAPYGEVSYDFGDDWIATAGARLFDTELRTASNVSLPPQPVPRFLQREAAYRGWEPKLSLQHAFSAEDMIYLLYSEGYRPGGFNAGGISPPAANLKVFSPDRLRNVELGAKSRLFDGLIELSSAVFSDFWDDIQTDQYLNSGLSYTTNVGDARVLGWETDATFHPLSGLTLGLDALLNSARLTSHSPTFVAPITSGLPGVAPVSFGTTVEYETPIDTGLSLRLGGEAAYVGRSRLTFQSTLSPAMGGYFTSKLIAGIKAADWRLTATLDNPLNTQGDTFAFGNPFSFGQVRQVTPLRPRTLSLILSANF